MKRKTKYEKQILHEIQELPVFIQKKIARVVHVFKEEMAGMIGDEKIATEQFLSSCGRWEDKRTIEEQVGDVYTSRRSRSSIESLS